MTRSQNLLHIPRSSLTGQQGLLSVPTGGDYENAKRRHLFRDLVDATAQVTITDQDIEVRFQKRAHNPLLLAAGFYKTDVPIPWLGGKRLRLSFG